MATTVTYPALRYVVQAHRTSVRPGRGWKESRHTGKPVESNFVVNCSCGFTMPCCCRDMAYAERRAVEHERTGR